MGVKSGRVAGDRLGYSQVVNPVYLLQKRTMTLWQVVRHISRNIMSNVARWPKPEPFIDRRGRLRGNLRGLADICVGGSSRSALRPQRTRGHETAPPIMFDCGMLAAKTIMGVELDGFLPPGRATDRYRNAAVSRADAVSGGFRRRRPGDVADRDRRHGVRSPANPSADETSGCEKIAIGHRVYNRSAERLAARDLRADRSLAVLHSVSRSKAVIFVATLAIAPISRGLCSPAMVTFMRQMNFRPVFIAELAGRLIGSASAIFVAYSGGGYWAIVANSVVSAVVTCCLTHLLAPYRPLLSLKHFQIFHRSSVVQFEPDLLGVELAI